MNHGSLACAPARESPRWSIRPSISVIFPSPGYYSPSMRQVRRNHTLIGSHGPAYDQQLRQAKIYLARRFQISASSVVACSTFSAEVNPTRGSRESNSFSRVRGIIFGSMVRVVMYCTALHGHVHSDQQCLIATLLIVRSPMYWAKENTKNTYPTNPFLPHNSGMLLACANGLAKW